MLFQNENESKDNLIKFNGILISISLLKKKTTNVSLFLMSMLNTPKHVLKPVSTTNQHLPTYMYIDNLLYQRLV